MDYYKAFVLYSEITEWQLYQDNPNYIKTTLHEKYWYAKTNIEAAGAKSFTLYVLVAVLLLAVIISIVVVKVIWKCRSTQKSTDEVTEELEETTH